MGLKPLPDELVLGQFRDWNEELQTARELPSDTVGAKVFQERSLFKVSRLLLLLLLLLTVLNHCSWHSNLPCNYKKVILYTF